LADCSNEFTKSFALTNATGGRRVQVVGQLLVAAAAQHVIQIAAPYLPKSPLPDNKDKILGRAKLSSTCLESLSCAVWLNVEADCHLFV